MASKGNMTKRVLIVDDQEDIRSMMRFAIEDFGYAVIEAAGPFEAVDKAKEYLPHLILMDIGMPLLDGLTTAQMIADRKGCEEIPIVVLTAYRNIREQALKAGCVDVLYKPVEIDKLRNMLDLHTH